ncbi:MAG: dual specificity protein phosphatase family protein [Bacteriovoracaceae bacterium]|nr:dual specificity protein phosphatase family protein [Bacteriovoracaceae bacterium]
MKIFILTLFAFPLLSWAISSPYSSTVKGITIGNAHELSAGVLRGSEPTKEIQQLSDYGIKEVIIFKNPTKTEVDAELAELKNFKIKAHHIAFKWKDIENMQEACEQVVSALQIIKKAQRAGSPIYFHCTVGEDRTGLLAGLFRMTHDRISTEQAWSQEMCPRGYADGNKNKPRMVTSAIHKQLTPLFLALAEKIESSEELSKSSCLNLNVKPSKKRCQ